MLEQPNDCEKDDQPSGSQLSGETPYSKADKFGLRGLTYTVTSDRMG